MPITISKKQLTKIVNECVLNPDKLTAPQLVTKSAKLLGVKDLKTWGKEPLSTQLQLNAQKLEYANMTGGFLVLALCDTSAIWTSPSGTVAYRLISNGMEWDKSQIIRWLFDTYSIHFKSGVSLEEYLYTIDEEPFMGFEAVDDLNDFENVYLGELNGCAILERKEGRNSFPLLTTSDQLSANAIIASAAIYQINLGGGLAEIEPVSEVLAKLKLLTEFKQQCEQAKDAFLKGDYSVLARLKPAKPIASLITQLTTLDFGANTDDREIIKQVLIEEIESCVHQKSKT